MALNTIKPKKGKLLLAEPMLKSPYFKRSVVLLTEHGGEGSVGFILNKPVDVRVKEIIPELKNADMPIYFGGPVSKDNLYYVHTLGEKLNGSQLILPDLYWGGSFEQLTEMINNNEITEDQIKFFIGYSGWEKDQLKGELDENSWIVADTNRNGVMQHEMKQLWKNTLRGMGNEFAILSNFPEDPSLN